jgi:hypothetical protein
VLDGDLDPFLEAALAGQVGGESAKGDEKGDDGEAAP